MREEFESSDDKPAWAGAHVRVLMCVFGAMQAWNENGAGDYFDDLSDDAREAIEISQGSQDVQSGEVELCIALFLSWLGPASGPRDYDGWTYDI
jgi:hypothetical protein